MRIIGLDIHRVFAEAVALEDGVFKRLGRIGMTRGHLEAFAKTLEPNDHIVVEATGNATAVTEILAPHVARVAVANPLQVHLIAKAKIKTDAIDAKVLAKLYAAGFLPEVWIPDWRRWLADGRSRAGPSWFDSAFGSSRSFSPSCMPISFRDVRMLTSSAARDGHGSERSTCRKTSSTPSSSTFRNMIV